MNPITQGLPSAVKIDGVTYPINTCSKNVLLTKEAFDAGHNGHLMADEVWEIFYENMFFEPYPPDPLKAFAAFEKFLMRCNPPDDSWPNVIDFAIDGEMIYDALYSTGLSEQEIQSMHWWNLLSRLSEVKDTKFNRVVYLRLKQRGIGGKITKEEREEIGRIGQDIINMVPEEDRKQKANDNAEIEAAFAEWANG